MTHTNTIVTGDCLDVLPTLPAGCADLVFADPPFNIGYRYDVYDDRKKRPDYLAWADRWLAEGDTVAVAGATFSILHCPGHSPGSVAYINAAQRFALVGDVLFRGSIGRTEGLPQASHPTLIESIKTKLLPLGDDFSFICGHGPTSSIGQERRTNPFLV